MQLHLHPPRDQHKVKEVKTAARGNQARLLEDRYPRMRDTSTEGSEEGEVKMLFLIFLEAREL